MSHTTSTNNPATIVRRAVPLFSVLLIIIAFVITLAQQPGRKVGKIEVEGLVRLSADEVIATSQLKTGGPFSIEELDAAGQRLVDSGLFSKVAYRTATTRNLVTVTFQVVEAKGGQSPVVFDNFVWFTNDELVAAIKREVPSFNGMAPDAGNMTDLIRHALQALLQEHQIPGTVEYAPEQAGINSSKQEHLFSVTGVPIPICELHFPGAKNVSEEKLVRSSGQLSNADYSLKSTIAFTNFILFPLYREVGQLRAKFGQPQVKLASAPNCKGGVDLSIPVAEGLVYLWDKAEWSGNETMPAVELDAALGMKQGEIANGVKFDKHLESDVRRRYGETGHLDVSFREEPEFDDAASRVSYQIAVKEGPQYRMGRLIIKGVSDVDSNALQASWNLKSREVFDASYFGRFMKTDAREVLQRIFRARQAQGQGPPQISEELTPDRQALTVDITLEFRN